MVIRSGGNVGIGLTGPSYKLDVAGDCNISTGSLYRINGAQHTHAAADIASGVIAPARLGTGTPTSSVFLRGDGTWTAPGSAGHTIQDEGTPLTARAALNFIGSGVTATDNAANNSTDITITSGGGGASPTIGALAVVNNGTPLTNSASQVSLFAGAVTTGSLTIPGSTIAVGGALEIEMIGTMSNPASSNPTLTIVVIFGATTINTVSFTASQLASKAGKWTLSVRICRDSTTTSSCNAVVCRAGTDGATTTPIQGSTAFGTSVDFSANQTLDIQAKWASANASCTIQNYATTVNVKNPTAGGAAVTTVFGRTGAVIATAGDYTAAQVTNAVSTISTYADPAWITSLNYSKLTGTQPAAFQTPWNQNIDGNGKTLSNAGLIGIGTAAPVSALHLRGAYISQAYEDPDVSVTGGGRIRLASLHNGSWAYQLNTAAAGDFSSAYAALTISAAGSIGVGINPTAVLHVSKSDGVNQLFNVYNSYNSGGSNPAAFIHSDQSYSGTYTGAVLWVTSYPQTAAGNQGDTFRCGTSAWDGSSFTPQLVVKSATGAVGIGNANPATVPAAYGADVAALDVNGAVMIRTGWPRLFFQLSGGGATPAISVDGSRNFIFDNPSGGGNIYLNTSSTARFQVAQSGHITQAAPPTNPGDTYLFTSSFFVYYDEAGSKLTFRVKSSSGVVKQGTLTLA